VNSEQYSALCARRQAFDNLVWQTPSLAIAAQSFLLSASLGSETSQPQSIALAISSGVVGIAAAQLMAKHRMNEVLDSELLEEFERENADSGFAVIHGKPYSLRGERNLLTRWSSYKVWMSVLMLFILLAAYALVQGIMADGKSTADAAGRDHRPAQQAQKSTAMPFLTQSP